MRKWNLPQVNTKVMCAVLTAAMVMTGFTACGGASSANSASAESTAVEEKETIAPESTTEQSTIEQTTEAAKENEEKVETYLGQITAIDGNVISVALAEKPEAPDGENPGDKAPKDDNGAPDGGKPAGEVPDGQAPDDKGDAANAGAPDKPSGEAPSDQKPEKDMLDDMTLTLSGDTMTITVNDDMIITVDGKEAALEDLQVGDTISFFLDGENVTSLSVGMPEKTDTMPAESMQAPEQK